MHFHRIVKCRATFRTLLQPSFAAALLLTFVLLQSGCKTGTGSNERSPEFSTTQVVGRLGANRYYTPANQILTPAGIQVPLPGMRPQAIALSPNGRLLVTASKPHEPVVLEAGTRKMIQQVPL